MSHGNTTVFDLGYVRRNGLVPEHYKVWWGFEAISFTIRKR
jgi:hypothetical protein